MKRKFAALMAAALGATALIALMPAQPASAANVCAGTGTATVDSDPGAGTAGLYYPVHPPQVSPITPGTHTILFFNGHRTASWAFGFGLVGTCTTGALTATGTLQGYCGHSTGTGTDTLGHTIHWTSLGSFLVLTGEITGLVNAVPDPLITGNSCLHNPTVALSAQTGALTFLIAGAAYRQNCTTPLPASSLVTLPGLNLLPTLVIPPITVHTSAHPCVGTKL